MANRFDKDTNLLRYINGSPIAINTVLMDLDLDEVMAQGKEVFSLHIGSLGTSGTVAVAFSNFEGSGYQNVIGENVGSTSTVSGITGNGLYCFPIMGRFCRVIMSTATTAGVTDLCASTLNSKGNRQLLVLGGGLTVTGSAAHDSAIQGNPVRMAARAVTANYAGVQSGDAADLVCTINGSQVVKPFSIPEADWQYAAAAGGIVNTTDVVARAAGAAGIRNYVTGIQLRNVSAVSTEFVIKDGSTVIWRTSLQANNSTPNDVYFPTPLKGTAAAALNVACVTTGAAVFANLQGYQAN